MKLKTLLSVVTLVAAAVAIAWACTVNFPSPGGPTVVVTQNQNSHNGGAAPDGTATSPAAGGQIPTPAYIRVGIFTQACANGAVAPDNAQSSIKNGCVATFTATPKDSNGADLQLPDAAFQGMSVTWAVSGGSCADLDAAGGNAQNKFNRQVKGAAVGTCSVCATVNSLTGCARQPDGEQLVKVVP